MNDELPALRVANASFVTQRLLVGGDLDGYNITKAGEQLGELLTVGVTHVVDCRFEADDTKLFARVPQINYLHHGIDDAGQLIPDSWFDTGVDFALAAFADRTSVVLAHCHMGINRGPSLGYAILLAQGGDPVESLDLIRQARPIANVWYAEDALRWHHQTEHASAAQRRRERSAVRRWRDQHPLDVVRVIAGIRSGASR